MKNLINFIVENKEVFLILTSLSTLLFSIFTFLKNNKDNKLKENILTSKMILQHFYSPLLNNNALNKDLLFDENILKFIYENSFLLDNLIKLLAFEIINLENDFNKTSNNRFLASKYKNTRKYFIDTISLASKDLSRIYKTETFSLSNKYLFPSQIRFIFNLLDTLSFIVFFCFIILTIFYFNQNSNLKITLFPIILVLIWIIYRFQILSMLKNFKFIAHKPNKLLSLFNIYLNNQYSEKDALYINLFTKKTYLVYRGLPIPKYSNLSFIDFFSIYKLKRSL